MLTLQAVCAYSTFKTQTFPLLFGVFIVAMDGFFVVVDDDVLSDAFNVLALCRCLIYMRQKQHSVNRLINGDVLA